MKTPPLGVVAIIPARGGSKGIPRKNLRRVGGETLIARAVRTARACPRILRVVVSTDDDEIGNAARSGGAEIVRRAPELATDTASSESVVLHALDELRRRDGADPDLIAFLQCTAPLLRVEDIEGTLDALLQDQADSALAVCGSHVFLWARNASNVVIGVNHDPQVRLRRQDRPPQFIEAGSVYVFRSEGFRRARHRFFGRIAMYEIPARRCLEVDDLHELDLADWIVRQPDWPDPIAIPQPVGGIVFDFDGVFTDNQVWTAEDGRESVSSNRSDGLAVERLRAAGIPLLVLSKERNPVVAARCAKLGLPCLQGVDDKLPALRGWAREQERTLANLVYVGNDANDVECLEAVGLGVAVADAWPEARRAAKLTLTRRGGDGAVRELCDRLLNSMHRTS